MNVSIQAVHWSRPHSEELKAIRRQVFIEEQGVPQKEEWDGLDDKAQHFLVLSSEHIPIGCARVLVDSSTPTTGSKGYHIGRVAVLADYRGQNIGHKLMQDVIEWCLRDARPHQARIDLNAQVARLSFYERLGFTVQGPLFMDAGIAHRTMRLNMEERWRHI